MQILAPTNKSLSQLIRELRPGRSRRFPLDRDNSVRATVSRISLETGNIYTCTREREKGIIIVKRGK